MFQDDIYPPCPAGEPSLTVDEWMAGVTRDPKLLKFTSSGLQEIPGVVDVSFSCAESALKQILHVETPLKLSGHTSCNQDTVIFDL